MKLFYSFLLYLQKYGFYVCQRIADRFGMRAKVVRTSFIYPLWAVVALTGVDLLGFGPTIRKAYHFPHDENVSFFVFFVARNSFAILALEHYSVTTVLFPAAIIGACLVLVLMINTRRRLVWA